MPWLVDQPAMSHGVGQQLRRTWSAHAGIEVAFRAAIERNLMATALAYANPTTPLSSEVSTTLTVGAGAAYEIFSDAVEIPRWLPIVQAARTLVRYPDGRPQRVAFTRKLERGSLGYTLEYRYEPANLAVAWTTPEASNVVLTGDVRFVALSNRA